MTSPAFCDPLSTPATTRGVRSGDLDPTVWGVSRVTTTDNAGSGILNAWAAFPENQCGNSVVVLPPDDIKICNNQLVEGMYDNTQPQILGMYPRQPFDIAGRTGKAVFDVSDNNLGSHTAWPVWEYTDQPVPAPNGTDNSPPSVQDVPRNAVGVSFAQTGANGGCGGVAGKVGVDDIFYDANYVVHSTTMSNLACVTGSTAVNSFNHVEIDISPTAVDVYMTDAGGSTLVHVASATFTVPLTRGLTWMIDAHYNACKEAGGLCTNTFGWRNFAFDGPTLTRDLGYEVPDAMTDGGTAANGLQQENLGYLLPAAFTLNNVTGVNNASAALLEFTAYVRSKPTYTYSANGGANQTFTDAAGICTYCTETFAMPIPLAQLQNGMNVINVSSNDANEDIANVDLILVGAGRAGGTPTPTPTATPTNTPTPTATPTNTPTATPTPSTCLVFTNQGNFTRPASFCTNQ